MRIASTVLSGFLVVGVAACGGKAKPAATTAGGDLAPDDSGGQSVDNPCGGGLCPPEKLDEIQKLLDRKRPAAARCLSDAVLAGKAPKRASGRVGLAFVIGRDGKARQVKIVESTMKNETVEHCVIEKVEQIDFGKVPTDLDWSYSYAFESN